MKKIIIFLLTICLVKTEANSQNLPFNELFPKTPNFFSPCFSASQLGMSSGDVNEDGFIDFVITCKDFTSNNYLTLLYGNCSGGLNELYDTLSAQGILRSSEIVVVDVNGDQHLDIILCGSDKILFYEGDGSGAFIAPIISNINSTNSPDDFKLSVADYNNDGIKDIYINAESSFQGVESGIFLGNASGQFTKSLQNYNPKFGYSVSADFNNDSFADILLADGSVLRNSGGIVDTVLFCYINIPQTSAPITTLNSDSDSLFEFYAVNDSVLFYGEINMGNFVSPSTQVHLPSRIISYTVNDFDKDGFKDDVAVLLDSALGIGNLRLLIGTNGVLTLKASPRHPQISSGIISTDVNNNGLPEIFNLSEKKLYRNLSNFRFASNNEIPIHGTAKYTCSADFDADGYDDIAAYTTTPFNNLTIMYGAPCGIREINEMSVRIQGRELKVANFNNDTFPDLVLSNNLYDSVYVLLNAGNGSFLPQVGYYTSHHFTQMAIADFDEDGYDDVFLLSTSPGRFNICTANANGNGSLNPPTPLQVAAAGFFNVLAEDPEPGDFDNDGHIDVSISHDNAFSHRMSIVYGDGAGNFPDVLIEDASYGYSSTFCAPMHLNNDGYLDMISTSSLNTKTYFFCRDSLATFWSNCYGVPYTEAYGSITVNDINGDSINDFIGNSNSSSSGYSSVNLLKPDYSIFNLQSIYSGYNRSSIGDVNGDNKSEIIYGNGPSVLIYENNIPTAPFIQLINDTLFVNAQQRTGSTPPSNYEWFKDNVLLTGFNQNYFPNPSPGLYHVGVLYSNGSYVSNKYRVLPVGLNDFEMDQIISIYPNPAKTSVRIACNQKIESISFSSINQQIIKHIENIHDNSTDLDVSEIPPGVYVVKIINKGTISIKKVIIN